MQAYSFSPTGELIGEVECQANPMAPGEYLVPAKATLTPPPEAGPDEHPRWNGKSWSLIRRVAIRASNPTN